jgi:hypothetical protein
MIYNDEGSQLRLGVFLYLLYTSHSQGFHDKTTQKENAFERAIGLRSLRLFLATDILIL